MGIDVNPRSNADVLCDLNQYPYPFKDSSFDQVYADNVIEHLTDVVRTVEEFQ